MMDPDRAVQRLECEALLPQFVQYLAVVFLELLNSRLKLKGVPLTVNDMI
jgi:hypothetical protein